MFVWGLIICISTQLQVMKLLPVLRIILRRTDLEGVHESVKVELLRPQECFLKKQQSWGQELPGQGIWGPSRGSFPARFPLHTSLANGPQEQHRLWLWHLCANRSMHLDFHFFSERNKSWALPSQTHTHQMHISACPLG